jgi:hypothetical protein
MLTRRASVARSPATSANSFSTAAFYLLGAGKSDEVNVVFVIVVDQ